MKHLENAIVTKRKERGGPNPMTIEEMQAIVSARRGRCLSSVYENSRLPLEWECARGHRWWVEARCMTGRISVASVSVTMSKGEDFYGWRLNS